jgi:putative RNA-binding protein, YhbY family
MGFFILGKGMAFLLLPIEILIYAVTICSCSAGQMCRASGTVTERILFMDNITSKQRAYLRGLSNDLEAIIHVGKASLTPEITKSVDEALEKRELVKVAVLKNCFDDPYQMADIVSERTHSKVVSVVGKKFVLYRPSKKNPKIQLPK